MSVVSKGTMQRSLLAYIRVTTGENQNLCM